MTQIETYHDQGDKYKKGHTVDLFITCEDFNYRISASQFRVKINPAPVVEERI